MLRRPTIAAIVWVPLGLLAGCAAADDAEGVDYCAEVRALMSVLDEGGSVSDYDAALARVADAGPTDHQSAWDLMLILSREPFDYENFNPAIDALEDIGDELDDMCSGVEWMTVDDDGRVRNYGDYYEAGDGTNRLETLRSDPMSSYELDGALDRRQTEMAGGSTAVSSPSDITTVYTVEPETALEFVEVVAGDAREVGWELELREPSGYVGIRRIGGITALLSIRASPTWDEVLVSLSSRS